jgi:hypothetical protein
LTFILHRLGRNSACPEINASCGPEAPSIPGMPWIALQNGRRLAATGSDTFIVKEKSTISMLSYLKFVNQKYASRIRKA